MAITPEQVTDAVVKAIPGFFNDAIDQFRQGEGAYIRDGEPVGIVAQVGQAVARSACRQYGAQGPDAVGSKGERFERACRPYLDSLTPGDGAQFETPFTGGQCDNAIYLGTATYESGPENSPTTSFIHFRHRGPILGVETAEGGVGIRSRGGTQNTSSSPTNPSGCGGAAPAPVNNPLIYRLVVLNGRNPSMVSVTACGLNDCGDPAPIVRPPTRRPDPLPPPFRFNPGDGIDIPINVDINPDGTINVDFGGDPVTVDPFPDEDEPGGGDPGDGGPEPIPPGDQGQPGTPVDVGPGDAAEDEDPDRNLVGVLVETIQVPPRAARLFNPTESYTKGAYFVYLGGDAGLSLIDTAAITRADQFYFAPPGCNRFRVVPNAGFTIRVTPYYED